MEENKQIVDAPQCKQACVLATNSWGKIEECHKNGCIQTRLLDTLTPSPVILADDQRLVWRQELEKLVEQSTDWGYDGESEVEFVSPFMASNAILHWLEEKGLIKTL